MDAELDADTEGPLNKNFLRASVGSSPGSGAEDCRGSCCAAGDRAVPDRAALMRSWYGVENAGPSVRPGVPSSSALPIPDWNLDWE